MPLVRNTKYTDAVILYMQLMQHATNTDIEKYLRQTFPAITATTVHRITARLVEQGMLRMAPNYLDGSMRFDINVSDHDHFMCSTCGELRDVSIRDEVIPLLKKGIEGCSVNGSLVISGTCKKCNEERI